MSPDVIALIITFRRLNTCLDTIRSIKKNIQYDGVLGFHIADLGSGKAYTDRILEEIGSDYPTTVSCSVDELGNTKGVGANMNLGTNEALKRSDFILHVEDDWELVNPLDLTTCVALLQQQVHIGLIRMGYISANVSGWSMSGAGKMWWKLIRTPGQQYIFSGHPHLKHRRFWEAYGPYPTDASIGHTELGMCGAFNNRVGPDIVFPAWVGDKQMFVHIGDLQSIKWSADHGEVIGYDEYGNPFETDPGPNGYFLNIKKPTND